MYLLCVINLIIYTINSTYIMNIIQPHISIRFYFLFFRKRFITLIVEAFILAEPFDNKKLLLVFSYDEPEQVSSGLIVFLMDSKYFNISENFN